MDTAAEPLINNGGRYSSEGGHGHTGGEERMSGVFADREDYVQGGEEEEGEVDESRLTSPGAFIWTLTVCAGVSGLLFGYDTGVISSTLVSINSDLDNRPLTTLDKSLITSATSFLALLASPTTGLLADAVGRKPVILAADLLFVVGALWQSYTTSVWGMILGRGIVGAAVGSASFVVPLYISELSPSPFRGRLVTVSSLFITGGQVVAYLIGWVYSERVGGWRWIVGLGAVPAVLQFGMLFAMPETPRFLIRRGKKGQAKRVLSKVYGAGEGMERIVNAVMRNVEREILEEEGTDTTPVSKSKGIWSAKIAHMSSTFSQLVSVGANRRALIIACMLQGFQQLCGFNSLMYFSATIFRLVGFHSPTLASMSIALTNFAFTLVAFWCIDRIGRRRMLLSCIPIMILGLALCAVAFSFLDLPDDDTGASHVLRHAPTTSLWPTAILLSMTLYVSSYASSLGCIPWQQSELFPLCVRSLGSSLATATNWFSNTIVGLTFLPMMELLTPSGAFAVYAAVCVMGWVAVWGTYPETAGLGLEEVGGLLREGFGVRESVERFRGRRGGEVRGEVL